MLTLPRVFAVAFPLLGLAALAGCPSDPVPPPPTTQRAWQQLAGNLPSALLSVSGPSSHDIYAVGADKGAGPLVVHYDGKAWQQLKTGQHGDLWWVQAFADGTVFAAGASSMVLRFNGATWERLVTPGLAKQTIFGVWGRDPNDLYFVGGAAGRDGFVWHYDGSSFKDLALPLDRPRLPSGEMPGFFKVWGQGDDVWVVGGGGSILHRKAGLPFQSVPSNTKETLFTVSGTADRVLAVGGSNNGVLVESGADGVFKDSSPSAVPLIQGVSASDLGGDWAVGEKGFAYARKGDHFAQVDTGLTLSFQSLHAAFVDSEGDLWAVGGNVLSPALDGGAMVHYGHFIPQVTLDVADAGPDTDAAPPAVCPPDVVTIGKDKSIARRWDEQIIASIRRDLPRPPVHARNLYHLAAAMWDAWAVYDATAKGVFVQEKIVSATADADRKEAISYAAYRVLSQRYTKAIGGPVSVACYRAVMADLAFDPDDATDTGTTPRAVGNRIGKAIVAAGLADGSNEAANYADPAPYVPVNPPLLIDNPGAGAVVDITKWQPLNLSVAATQNGIILPAGVQGYIGSNWDGVKPFAMKRASDQVPWHDPGPMPTMGQEMRDWVAEVILRSSQLDAADPTVIDISPGAYGNNTLGANDGAGRATNPVTGLPYTPQPVLRGDFGRVLAEFWADGPKSETPPGHWNVLANAVADSPAFPRKLYGAGTALDPLAWDVRVYLAVNGAVHDAAITSWGLKRRTLCSRPITLIRWMGAKGQATDPTGEAYSPDGLPLIAGLIEVITKTSSAPGERHEALAPFVGQIAIRSWRSEPGDRTKQVAGAGWIRAVDWMPYQRRNFVTPAFPGFTSGHSTFSRSAAEALTILTGSPFFPGGLGEYAVPKDTFLSFEIGPSAPLKLQWATYYDAADQAGQSRIWGSIHISVDDFAGRKTGRDVGIDAATLAGKYFDGTAP